MSTTKIMRNGNDNDNGVLILVRHGQSTWNKKNLFTGWANPPLTNEGIMEARRAARIIEEKNIPIDAFFSSNLIRAIKTLDVILSCFNGFSENIKKERFCSSFLNERNYGELTGINKEVAMQRWGKELVHKWRRSYEENPPGGESLKQTKDRVAQYFDTSMRSWLSCGKNILVVAHGNSLRALKMYVEDISPELIEKENIETCVPMFIKYKSQDHFVK